MCGSNEASRSTGYLEQISLSRLTRSVIVKLNSRECFDRLLAIRRWNKQSFACENLFGFHSKDDDVRVRTRTKVSLSTLFFRFFGTDVAAYQCLHVPCRIPRCTLLLFNYPLLSTLSAAVYPVACQEFISSEERLRSLYTKFWILPALAAFAPRV